MSNKLTSTKKKMASLGIKKTENGDIDYIDVNEKNKSKYNKINKESQLDSLLKKQATKVTR